MAASCETCRAPGNCCKGFVLSIGKVPVDGWRERAQAAVDGRGLPFRAVSIRIHERHDEGDSVTPVFDCTLLGPDGRCTDYENRPSLCRTYQPGEDPLCAEYIHTLKGIPIVLA